MSLMCIVYTSTSDNITSDGLKNVLVINHTRAIIQLYKSETLISFGDEEGEIVVSSLEPGNKVEVVVVFENGFIVKRIAVYLVYDKPTSKTIDLYHLPDQNVIDCNGDESECIGKRISTEEESTDDFNQTRKKKSMRGKNQLL